METLMRPCLVLAVALMAMPFASSAEAQPRDTLAVSLYDIDETTVLISWSAAPGATSYDIYVGPTPDDVALLGESTTTVWLDESEHSGTMWYVIVAKNAQGFPNLGAGDFRGACVNQRGATGLSITVSHCIPTRPF